MVGARRSARPVRFGAVMAAGAVFFAALVSGCSLGRVTSQETTSPDGSSSSRSVSLHGDADEATLSRARQASAEGRFDEATSVLERLHADSSVKSAIREQALLQLGEIQTNVLNATRDAAKARGYFETFLEEFPESPLRPEAERRLADLPPPRSANP